MKYGGESRRQAARATSVVAADGLHVSPVCQTLQPAGGSCRGNYNELHFNEEKRVVAAQRGGARGRLALSIALAVLGLQSVCRSVELEPLEVVRSGG